jgi:S1-C subfamily serine protease
MKKRILLLAFLGLCAFLGGEFAVSVAPRLETPVNAGPQQDSAGNSSELIRLSDRFELVASRVAPAVVYIEASKPARLSAAGKTGGHEESGSGVLIRADGQRQVLVLTNNHVVSQTSPEQISVSLADGRLFRPNRVLSDSESDIAVLRLDVDNLPTATLGDSDRVRVGQWVLAIGSPFGLNQTVTHGIISAKERGQIGLGASIRIKEFLQTDAAINPGSSGGPLVNLDGEVIGINTAIASQNGSSSGVAFSIPANLVKRIVKQLLDKGVVSRGYLGMQLAQSFEPGDAVRLGLDRVRGAWVEVIYPETPASAAGLRVNDIVLQVDELSIRDENHLINHISMLAPGQRVRLQVWRDRKMATLEAVVGDWAQGQARFRSTP